MEEHLITALAAIVVLGIGAQWLSWRLHLPSILMLLVIGFIAGPVTDFLHPDEMFGELLFPAVSVSVGLILFEGGLSLRLRELRESGAIVRNLITLGAAITWALAAVLAIYVLDMDFRVAILLGAILTVTGPTVIQPLLRQIRPKSTVGNALKWEGILIDPVGATLAVLVYEAIVALEAEAAALAVAAVVFKTLLVGGVIGVLAGFAIMFMLRRRWIPDFLQSPVALMTTIGAFALCNHFQIESGLLGVTVMGVFLANQRSADIRHIVEFKENLRVLLLSFLFIVLSARLQLSDFLRLPWQSLFFLAALVIVVRPLSVAVSTLGSNFSWPERLFLAWMAPRGIVAAAVASVFSLRLAGLDRQLENADLLAPVTFLVIVGTVTFYGLTAGTAARLLKVSHPNPQGLLIVGAHVWARAMATEIQNEGITVRLVDRNWNNVSLARLEGLPAYYGSILAERTAEEVDLAGIGRLLALTQNQETNSLAALHFTEIFGRSEVYQLAPEKTETGERTTVARQLRGRILFARDLTYNQITRLYARGWIFKKTPLTKEFTFQDFTARHGEDAIPLMTIEGGKKLRLMTPTNPPKPQPGQILLSLMKAQPKKPPKAREEKAAETNAEDDHPGVPDEAGRTQTAPAAGGES